MDSGPGRASLEIDIFLCRRAGSQSGTGLAQSILDAWRGNDAATHILRGFGDMAYRYGGDDGITFDGLGVRKATVVINVTYIGPAPYATAVAADDALISDAVRRIRLS